MLSPDDRPGDIRDKVQDYLTAGTPMVLTVDPVQRRLTVYRPGARPHTCGAGESIDLDPVVSGFNLQIASLFE